MLSRLIALAVKYAPPIPEFVANIFPSAVTNREDVEDERARQEERARMDFEVAIRRAQEEARVHLRLPNPPPSLLEFYTRNGRFAYVRTPAYDRALEMLVRIRDAYPTTEYHQYPVVLGPIGVGKTRLARELATALANMKDPKIFPNGGVAVSIDVGKLAAKIRYWNFAITDPLSVVAAAIFHGIFPDHDVPPWITFPQIVERVENDWNTSLIVLHMDEFNRDTALVNRILKACHYTSGGETRICVLPIVTGVRPAKDWEVRDLYMAEVVPLRHFVLPVATPRQPFGERMDLEAEFARSIGIEWDRYAACERLRQVYRDCGGHPNLVQILADIINFYMLGDPNHRGRITGGYISSDNASYFFRRLVEGTSRTYSNTQWRDALCPQRSKTVDDEALTRSIRHLLHRVALCALTDRRVEAKKIVLEGATSSDAPMMIEATYLRCAELGLVDVIPVKRARGATPGSELVMISGPLIALLAMSEHSYALPYMSSESNPFEQRDETHQELGLTTLYLRLKAAREFGDLRTPLSMLRPGAMTHGASDVWVGIPGVYLGVTTLEGFVSWLDDFCDWQLLRTVWQERAVDGLGVMSGGRGSSEALPILWLSRMKKRKLFILTDTGAIESTATLYDMDIMRYVKEMRKVANEVRRTLASKRSTGGKKLAMHVVYDIFTDRLPPKRNTDFSRIKLKDDETLFVTTAREFSTVVGKVFAARLRTSKLVPGSEE